LTFIFSYTKILGSIIFLKRKNYYLNNGMYPGNLTTAAGTIAHEFGHIAGLAHPTANVYSIMHQLWHPYRVQFITQYDITELQNKY